ncbi:hypothetical protein GN244_ATG09605 [Phytophthora infestans]|uniref:Uncharacterized protein n=1 Tax=Phytophthora infestans TaxID=4787 RepID=A0A833SUD4_PHYIN|nr:hypothetical protein GN244_ATG09605 [Phytophthora infestans]
MAGPMCKQCEAKIDPLLLNPQRSATDTRARCVGCGRLQYGYALRTISGRGSPPPPDSGKVRRKESLANVKKAMGPDWYPKKKKRRSRPLKLTARNAKYIEQKKQQKSR